MQRTRSCSSKPTNDAINDDNNTVTNEKDTSLWGMAPKMRNIKQWDKYEWIFSVASLVQFIGFSSYDVVVLRALSLASAAGLMVAHMGRRFFVGWFWAFTFAAANGIVLYFFLREKYSHSLVGLTDEERLIYSVLFEPYHITPLEYRTIIRLGHFVTMRRGETLTVSGLLCDKVFLVLSGQCVVLNNNQETVGVISGGHKESFVGEIALIDDTQDVSTATVKTNGESTRLLYWNVPQLKHLLESSKADIRVKLINVFTASMKLKLLHFNENFNVEKSIQFKQQNLESIVQMLLIAKGKLKITESDSVDKCQMLMEEDEQVELSVDEELFLREYIKQKQVTDTFTDTLMKKYHINMAGR